MMFIVRSRDGAPDAIQVKLSRPTPAIVPDASGYADFFCVGDAAALASLREAGWAVVALHDGFYEDGKGGGVAIWGQGRYWEIRSDPLTVIEAVGASDAVSPDGTASGHVEIRRAIFGA